MGRALATPRMLAGTAALVLTAVVLAGCAADRPSARGSEGGFGPH